MLLLEYLPQEPSDPVYGKIMSGNSAYEWEATCQDRVIFTAKALLIKNVTAWHLQQGKLHDASLYCCMAFTFSFVTALCT